MNIRMRNVSDDNARDKVAVLGAYLINAIFNFSRGDLKAAGQFSARRICREPLCCTPIQRASENALQCPCRPVQRWFCDANEAGCFVKRDAFRDCNQSSYLRVSDLAFEWRHAAAVHERWSHDRLAQSLSDLGRH